MSNPTRGWFIEKAQDADCACGTMKQHWITRASKPWPATCSVAGCTGTATSAVRALHATVQGAQLVVVCDTCRSQGGSFNLKESAVIVTSEEVCG